MSTFAPDTQRQQPTGEMARFVSGVEADALPPVVPLRLAQCLLDFLGVAVAGRVHAESTPAFLEGMIEAESPDGPATVIGETRGYPARDAALLNGAFAHSLDFDDTNLPGLIHPGAVVIPAALATAERVDGDGERLIAAIAAGYEVCCRIGIALGEGAYRRGFHPTAVAGVFGAVAAVARIRDLPAETVESAFGLAGSMACGSMQYLETGSWNKRLHPGLAAHNGLLAVDLARSGVVGAAHALEGGLGFLHGYTDTPEPGALTDGLGERWVLAETGIKPYPACRLAHGAVDAAIELRRRLGGAVPTEAPLSLRISPAASLIVGGDAPNKRSPQNTVDGQFSVYFQTAVALLDGAVSWSSYERLGDPDVRSLIDRIELAVDGRVETAGAVLRCEEIEVRVDRPAGEPDGEPSWEGVEAKYHGLAADLYDERTSVEIAAWAKRLPSEEPVRDLGRLLRR